MDHNIWATYKNALKLFIYGFTKDKEYFAAKLKVQSVSNNWGFELGLDANYNLLKWGKYSISRKHMETKYPNNMLKQFVIRKHLGIVRNVEHSQSSW